MSGETTNDDSLISREIQGSDDEADDRGKSVSVVKAERSHAVATPAEIDGFVERHGLAMVRLPPFFGRLVTVRGRLVEGTLRLAQHRVLRGHDLPSERLKPRSDPFHGSFVLFDRDRAFCPDHFLRRPDLLNSGWLQVAFPGPGVNRLGGESILDGEPLGHELLEHRIP